MLRRNWRAPAVLPAACIVLALAGCTKERVVDAKAPEETKVVEAPDPNVVKIDHLELFQLAEVESKKVANELSVNGVIAPDVSRNVPVNALTSGRVIDLR